MSNRKKKITALLLFLALLLVALRIYFPGRQMKMAFSIATGVGISEMQARVNELEEKAIARADFTEEDKEFLRDLYTCMAKGGKLTLILLQTGQMMDHYLSCSGESLKTASRIFAWSPNVTDQMDKLRNRMLKDLQSGVEPKKRYASGVFYMPHWRSPDSIFGLYHGRVFLKILEKDVDEITLGWRAEVPWIWPSYESLFRKHNEYHAECFAIPNLRMLAGKKYALYIDNGLGEYLTQIGLAKSFLVFAEWEESLYWDPDPE